MLESVYIEAAARFAANQEGAALNSIQVEHCIVYLLQFLLHAEV